MNLKEQIESIKNITITWDNRRFFEFTVNDIFITIRNRGQRCFKLKTAETKEALHFLKGLCKKYEEFGRYAAELAPLFPEMGF